MRLCSMCREDKLPTEFYKDPRVSTGLARRCKQCCKAIAVNRQASPNRSKYYAEWKKTPAGRKSVAAAHAMYHIRHLEKNRASDAVNNAVRDGRLLKPQACEMCKAGEKLEGHHGDYSKLLEVVWLCGPCHKQVHKELRRQDRSNPRTEIVAEVL